MDWSRRFFRFEITETVATEYKEEVYEAVEVFVKDGIACAWMILVPGMPT